MNLAPINLVAGWMGLLGGVASGMVIGLCFHRDGWLGGYGSFRRRLVRLGHIAFLGLGFVNVLYALSVAQRPIAATLEHIASGGFMLGAVTMPLCCFLAAWRTPFRHLFPVPVASILAGVLSVLIGWVWA
ncbi:MAG: hypothetical protein A3G25_15815 [Betaproteobacteria bacterium RIFCSPLOWO2_12_FULL_63_13]|nr:MAG: hypothetical protein A3H32_12610 [Betaproteobacteria bacterium RIFCSPLOWO2_02_FULL_63_19]OGA42948.1 MAG: hypothetical protein A3G25_15815 [Betaproteobacteria bacterium RIFCSPLOWO2_12_FULL_63_13]